MRRLRFILYNAEIERVPRELWREPAIVNDSRRRRRHPSKILLYSPIHYTAMIKHGIDPSNRGRPDITLDILRIILNHPLTKSLDTEIYVSTVEGVKFWVNPETRIPHNYFQFEGLMIQLLEKGMVPPDDGRFLRLVEEIPIQNCIGLESNGEPIESIKKLPEELCIVIGAFQKGSLREHNLPIEQWISVSNEDLLAHIATCIFLTKLEEICRR